MTALSMNILVTGANGFLGSHIVEALKQKHDLTCLVRRSIKVPGTNTVIFDSYTEPNVESAIKETDILIHVAAQLHGPSSEMHESNVAFTRHLVELATKYKIRQFIYISSENVTQGNEDLYSRTKALGEKEVEAFHSYLIIRPTIIYGSGDKKYVERLVNIIKKYPLVPVLGNGKSRFQFVYVDDLVKVISYAIDHSVTGIYTIAGPESISYNDFMKQLMDAMHIRKKLLHVPIWMLRPLSRVFNLLFKNPPLTPTQLDNLMKDRVYDMKAEAEYFNYQPVSLKSGLEKILQHES
jgi:nucleoside-diphosphate-sugar epimerase